MKTLLERMQPYLDQQEAEYPPGLYCAVAFAAQAGDIVDTEEDAVLDAVEADQDATGWRTFKVNTFTGTREGRVSQWREWAEAIIQSVDK